MRLTAAFFERSFEIFSPIFHFLRGSRLKEMGILQFPVGKSGFRVLSVSHRVVFGTVELMKF